MAEAVVSFVIERLGDLLLNEVNFLCGVRNQVTDAQTKLQWMCAFLKDADAHVRDGDERVRLWVVRVRDTSYDLEDVIETYVLKVASNKKKSRGVISVMKRYTCFFKKGIDVHKVGSDIEKISSSIASLTSNLQTYGIRELRVKEGETSSNNIQQQRELRRAYSHVVENDVVGFDKDIKELVAHLTKEENACNHRVISVCGMGGLGKTTLARKVYHHPQVRTHFECFAWVSISQQCVLREVWEGILFGLTSPTKEKRKEIRSMSDSEIAKELYNLQKHRKCLVLLDDIWDTLSWDRLKAAFPLQEAGSKILLTTRVKNVALHADQNGFIHEPQCLNEKESWELFQNKSGFERYLTNSQESELKKELGREMLKHCGGLPLAIIVLGGLLSTKHTVNEWVEMKRNVMRYITKGREHGDSEYHGVSWVLGLSYDELPYYLKPCFLYLAHYPEDITIQVKELCLTLVAEGVISLSNHKQSSVKTMEDVAYDCLSELVERSMIKVRNWGSTRRMKSLCIHDLIRDVCMSKAQTENFIQFVDLRNKVEGSLESVSVGWLTNTRRVAIYNDYSRDHHNIFHFADDINDSLRCLITDMGRVAPKKEVFKHVFNRFMMLRVLKLGNSSNIIYAPCLYLPKEIGNLIHLRLFSIRNRNVSEIPYSLGNLRCLQTLNLLGVYLRKVKLPNVIWKLEQLRHLYLPYFYDVADGKCLRLSNLRNMQTLSGLRTKYQNRDDFLQLTNLRKLRLCVDTNLVQIFHKTEIVTFNCLWSLVIYNEDGMVDITPVILSYPQIYKLKLWSLISRLPEESQFPQNLMKLELCASQLKDDPMPTLGKLQNLRILVVGYKGYDGNEMVCLKEGFPRLESLSFWMLEELKQWKVEEGALSCLHFLKIDSCLSLSTVSDGLRYITTLKEMVITDMPKEFKERLKEGGEDFYKVSHVPSLVFLNSKED